jgi:outer membrane protein insertion porin family
MKKFIFSLFTLLILIQNISAQEMYELVKIRFEGNSALSSSELRDIILSEETPWFFWKFLNKLSSKLGAEAVYFDSSNIPIDLESLEAYYNANGFFLPRFEYSYEIDTAKSQATLIYKIDEGPPSQFGELRTTGLSEIPDFLRNQVFEELIVDTNDRYSQFELSENIESSLPPLLNNGYMFALYDSSEVYIDTVALKGNTLIHYTTGGRFRIDTLLLNIQGEGAQYVEEDLIIKLVDINPGEFFNMQKIRQSQHRLFRSGLFNSIVIQGSERDTAEGWVPLRVEGNIGHMNELSPEIILNNQNNALNVGLGANYIRKNFLGQARRLNVNTSFGIQEFFNTNYLELFDRFSFRDTVLLGYLEARLTIDQPYVFSRPVYGRWSNYARVDKQPNFNISTFGTKLLFEFELPPFTFINFLSTYYNLEQSNEYYMPTQLRGDSISRRLLSIIGLDFGKTTADDILFPRHGYNLAFIVEEANSLPYLFNRLQGDRYEGTMFYRLQSTASYYWGFGLRRVSVFAVKLKLGHLQAYYGDYDGLPLNRTFYAGGSNSVRGWRANELPGRDVKGGTFLVESSAEYRWRFLESAGMAFFYDAGNTWREGISEFRFNDLAMAVGLGFRYYTAIAPFRIDFGFKFYDPADRRYLWEKPGFFKQVEFHFGIGEAF